MQPIVVFVILAVVLGGFFYFGQTPEQEEELSSEQLEEPLPETKESVPVKTQTFLGSVKSAAESPKTKPTISINTYITSGPKEGEVIDDTNKVTFEFKAKVSPEETEGRISFETKVEGFDEDWKRTYSEKREINLPSGPKEYTFLVRAKIKNITFDPTPARRNFKINTSPYFDKVKISSVRIETTSRSSLITLSTYLKNEEEINITGWKIKGRRGSFVIPGGIEKYSPYYNPVPSESIFVKRGDIIYLSGSLNPLGKGRNFRPNKCLGYLTNYHDFPIPLPKNCPKPTREEISHLDPCCQEFILRMRTCEAPNYSGNITVSRDSECLSYLDKNFNYAGCYKKYSKDEDFIGRNWHIYTNRNIVAGDDCDTLYLQDQNGLIVDKHSYGRPICK